MNHDHDDHGGLGRDLRQLSRRQLLGFFAGGAAAGFLIGCTDNGADSTEPDAGSGDGTGAV